MKGIQYLVNEQGKKTAVLIDLEEHAELWADFQDILMSKAREEEAEVSWSDLQMEMDEENLS